MKKEPNRMHINGRAVRAHPTVPMSYRAKKNNGSVSGKIGGMMGALRGPIIRLIFKISNIFG